MASSLRPLIQTYKCDAAIAKGLAVKIGTDRAHVAYAAATTQESIGIAQGATTTAEDKVEVALPGGGAKGLAQTTIVAGQLLTQHTDGSLKPVGTAGDRVIAIAMEGAVAGDLFDVMVAISQTYTTNA